MLQLNTIDLFQYNLLQIIIFLKVHLNIIFNVFHMNHSVVERKLLHTGNWSGIINWFMHQKVKTYYLKYAFIVNDVCIYVPYISLFSITQGKHQVMLYIHYRYTVCISNWFVA